MSEVKERNGTAGMELVESDVDVQELQSFSSLLDRDMIVRMGQNMMGVHPNAKEIGELGMRTVAQLALMTGANPLPGTNGIHAWRDNKGNLNIMFGIGFWRGEAEKEGGIVWIDRPRPMTDEERQRYKIADDELGAIAEGALQRDVFDLLREAREMGLEMSLKEAKAEVARVGIATTGTETWGSGDYKDKKNGRPLIWTAIEGAERDLLRQLVPILKRARENLVEGTHVEGGPDWSVRQHVRMPVEGGEIEEREGETPNDVLFGPEPDAEDGDYEEVDEEPEGPVDEDAVAEAEAVTPDPLESKLADLRAMFEEMESITWRDIAKAAVDLGLHGTHREAYAALETWPMVVKHDVTVRPRGGVKTKAAQGALAWLAEQRGATEEE